MPRSVAARFLALLALSGAAGCCLEITGESTGNISGPRIGTSAGTGSSTGLSGTGTGSSNGSSGTSTGFSTGSATGTGTSSSGGSCVGDNRWIYVVDGNTAMLARLDPVSLTFANIGVLDCPAAPGDLPDSMAVDRNGVAWIFYASGNLFQADASDAGCTATGYALSPQAPQVWSGMSFLTPAGGGPETLYVDEQPTGVTTNDFAILEMPSFVLDPIGNLSTNSAELAETDEGELWAYSWLTQDDGTELGSELAQLDPATGSILQSTDYPGISIDDDFAVKFSRGSFWIFIGSDVYQVPRDTLVPTLVVSNDGYDVIGAGVSNCQAP